MNNNLAEQRFLQHLIILIKENLGTQVPMSKTSNDFDAGKSLAYHEVADLVMECSRLFNVPLANLGIADFDPDVLL
jgi:hypothetical protein